MVSFPEDTCPGLVGAFGLSTLRGGGAPSVEPPGVDDALGDATPEASEGGPRGGVVGLVPAAVMPRMCEPDTRGLQSKRARAQRTVGRLGAGVRLLGGGIGLDNGLRRGVGGGGRVLEWHAPTLTGGWADWLGRHWGPSGKRVEGKSTARQKAGAPHAGQQLSHRMSAWLARLVGHWDPPWPLARDRGEAGSQAAV
jgi:hypothetical protein